VAQSYTVDTLIESARRRGQLTRSAGSLDLSDLVELMNEELQTYMMSFLLSLKEEFAVATYDYTTTSGQYAVSLPPRAIGGKVREIMVKDEDQYRRISRVEPTRVLQPPSNDGTPDRYYFEGNKIIVDPCGAADIRIKYFRRPGALVLEADAGVITAINTGTKTVTLSSLPDGFTTSEEYDFVQSSPPFDTLGMDLAVTGISGNDVTFSATLPTDLVVGDYLCLAGEAPVRRFPSSSTLYWPSAPTSSRWRPSAARAIRSSRSR
jgi:hypothetical protein